MASDLDMSSWWMKVPLLKNRLACHLEFNAMFHDEGSEQDLIEARDMLWMAANALKPRKNS